MAAAWGVTGRVAEQIRNDLLQAEGITPDDQFVVCPRDHELVVAIFDEVLDFFEGIIHDASNADRFEFQTELAARHAGDVQEVIDHLVELLHLAIDDAGSAIFCPPS